ncbi:MAG: Rab family GTPase [Candidatus Hermodarchaeota archaeon]
MLHEKVLKIPNQQGKILKIIIAGNSGVGKTTLLKRFIEGTFIQTSNMTVGVEHFIKEIYYFNTLCKMQLWDLGGQDRFRYIVDFALRGTHGALLLFDITNYTSFVSLDKWVNLLRSQSKKLPILLVATKCDLYEYSVVKNVLIPKIVERNQICDYIETSSKTGQNVENVFEILIKNLISPEA